MFAAAAAAPKMLSSFAVGLAVCRKCLIWLQKMLVLQEMLSYFSNACFAGDACFTAQEMLVLQEMLISFFH